MQQNSQTVKQFVLNIVVDTTIVDYMYSFSNECVKQNNSIQKLSCNCKTFGQFVWPTGSICPKCNKAYLCAIIDENNEDEDGYFVA